MTKRLADPPTKSKFPELAPGDTVRIIYHGAAAALMQVTKVNSYSIEGMDGESKCKITWVSDSELRFYGELGPDILHGDWNRTTVLRNVQIRKVAAQ